MICDFLFWSATAGLGPITSRMAEAHLSEGLANLVIARMLLTFTVGALAGRFFAGWWKHHPKVPLRFSMAVSGLGLCCYLSDSTWVWLIGQSLQGFSLGLYGVSMFRFTATLIPPGKRMRGFALIGMADFLGFAFGPVLSGLLYGWIGFAATFKAFLTIIIFAMFVSRYFPAWSPGELEAGNSKFSFNLKGLGAFAPLHLALLLCLLYHIFYSRYLPVLYHTPVMAIESWFFSGYIVGGLGIRMGFIGRLEKMSDRRVFAIALVFMMITAVLVAFFPMIDRGLGVAGLLTGVFYGVGFEALYIFCLTYIASNTNEQSRGRAIAFVFMGFDISNLVAGISFGPLANSLGPNGLFLGLLAFLPLVMMLPLFLKNTGIQQSGVTPVTHC